MRSTSPAPQAVGVPSQDPSTSRSAAHYQPALIIIPATPEGTDLELPAPDSPLSETSVGGPPPEGVPFLTADKGGRDHYPCASHVFTLFLDTLSSDLLDKIGFIVNTAHKTLICTSCEVSVDHEQLSSHFVSRSHKSPRPKGDIQGSVNADIQRIFPQGLVFPPTVPTEAVDAIFGLAAPMAAAARCSACSRWFKAGEGASRSFDAHECVPNQKNPTGRFVAQTSHVQQFFAASGSARFPVRIVEPSPEEPSPMSQYLRQREQEVAAETAPPALSENHRVFHQFLRKEKWIDHLAPYPAISLPELHQITLKDIQFPRLARHIECYLLDMQEALDSYHVRRLLGLRPGTE